MKNGKEIETLFKSKYGESSKYLTILKILHIIPNTIAEYLKYKYKKIELVVSRRK